MEPGRCCLLLTRHTPFLTVGSKLKCPVLVAHDMSGFKLTSSRRGCGKVGIPRGLRGFQARWESRLFDFSNERLFRGSSRPRFVQQQPFGVVTGQWLGSVGQGEGSVQMLMPAKRTFHVLIAP